MRNLDNATAGGSRPETAEDIANQAIKDAKLAEDQVIAGQLQGTTGGMWRPGVEDVLAARGQGAASHAKEKKKQDDFHFQIRVQRLLEELQERIEELSRQIEDLRREEETLRQDAQENFDRADELEDLIEAHKSGKPLTPEQQRMLREYKEKNPGKDMDDIVAAILVDVDGFRATGLDKDVQADALAEKREKLEDQRERHQSKAKQIQYNIANNIEDPALLKSTEDGISKMSTSVESMVSSESALLNQELGLGMDL